MDESKYENLSGIVLSAELQDKVRDKLSQVINKLHEASEDSFMPMANSAKHSVAARVKQTRTLFVVLLIISMPVPWEALIPFGLVTALFGAAGTLLNVSKRAQNQGKPPRYHIDSWEEMLMDRDKRLTGHARKQTSNPIAPEGFETSSVWYTERTQ